MGVAQVVKIQAGGGPIRTWNCCLAPSFGECSPHVTRRPVWRAVCPRFPEVNLARKRSMLMSDRPKLPEASPASCLNHRSS